MGTHAGKKHNPREVSDYSPRPKPPPPRHLPETELHHDPPRRLRRNAERLGNHAD